MDTSLHWDDEQLLLGVQVRVHFFDPGEVNARTDWVARLLPVLGSVRPTPLHDEAARGSYAVGDLQVSPDAVFEHGNGLLCVSYRSGDRLAHDPERWPRQLRIDAMLQAIVTAMAVSGQRQKPTAALLRCHNALYQFDPSPPVLECLATGIPAARRYWNEPAFISARQLASYCEPQLRALPVPPGSLLPPDQCETAFADTTPSAVAINGA